MRLTIICNELKQTISISSGFELLQMVSESDIERCANEDAGPPRGWFVRSHIDWRGERNIPHKGVETCDVSHRLGRRTKHPL